MRAAALGVLFLLAVGVGLELARPFRSAAVAFDSQVAVVHFERIMSGQRIEAFVSTTPKPLLTVIFGTLHALTGDWRPLSWATILAFGLSIVGVGLLFSRVAGSLAGAFAAVAVLAAPTLLLDAALALATPWALLGWVAAGLAVTGDRPRYGWAGLALLLATLARVETFVVIGISLVVLAVTWAARRPIPPAAWLTPLIGLGALPVLAMHDWLLTGDPLFWSTVATKYSQANAFAVMSPAQVIGFLAGRYAAEGALSLLAIVGVIRLLLDRQWAVATGLIALGPGIASFLVLLAVRGIFVSDRYAAPIDIAVLAAAGVGAAGLSLDLVERWRASRRWGPVRWPAVAAPAVVPAALGILAAVVLAWPTGPLNHALRTSVRVATAAAVDADRARATLRTALANDPSQAARGVLVPTSIRPRLTVDLGLLLTETSGTDHYQVDPAAGRPAAGQLIYHDRHAERKAPSLNVLEVATETPLGSLTIVPVAADPARGWWIVRIR
jgi:hypothetical protein